MFSAVIHWLFKLVFQEERTVILPKNRPLGERLLLANLAQANQRSSHRKPLDISRLSHRTRI
jgi:hypothetical protein